MVSSKSLGKSIKSAREKAGITQDDLSDRAGLAYSTLAKIEQGAIKNPSVFTVLEIAKALNSTVEELTSNIDVIETQKQSNEKLKFIYCDVNGVMVRFYHHAFASLAEETGAPFDKVETAFWHYNDPTQRGEISMAEFNKSMARYLKVDKIDWAKHYMSSVQPLTEVHELLERLHKRYKIGLLTNILPGFLDAMFASNKLPDLKYDAIIDSSVVKVSKPEDKIYREAEKQAKASGGEIFFIDDSRANLTAAERFGWRVFWFDDYDPIESVRRIEESLAP